MRERDLERLMRLGEDRDTIARELIRRGHGFDYAVHMFAVQDALTGQYARSRESWSDFPKPYRKRGDAERLRSRLMRMPRHSARMADLYGLDYEPREPRVVRVVVVAISEEGEGETV